MNTLDVIELVLRLSGRRVRQAVSVALIVLSLAVFRMLALPLGIMLAGGLYIVFVFYMFSMSPYAGYASLALIGVAVGSIYVWEKTHPPTLEE